MLAQVKHIQHEERKKIIYSCCSTRLNFFWGVKTSAENFDSLNVSKFLLAVLGLNVAPTGSSTAPGPRQLLSWDTATPRRRDNMPGNTKFHFIYRMFF